MEEGKRERGGRREEEGEGRRERGRGREEEGEGRRKEQALTMSCELCFVPPNPMLM